MQRSFESISYSNPAASSSSSSSRLELLSSDRSSVEAAEELSLDCCCFICSVEILTLEGGCFGEI